MRMVLGAECESLCESQSQSVVVTAFTFGGQRATPERARARVCVRVCVVQVCR